MKLVRILIKNICFVIDWFIFIVTIIPRIFIPIVIIVILIFVIAIFLTVVSITLTTSFITGVQLI